MWSPTLRKGKPPTPRIDDRPQPEPGVGVPRVRPSVDLPSLLFPRCSDMKRPGPPCALQVSARPSIEEEHRERGRAERPSQLVIRDGTIEFETTY